MKRFFSFALVAAMLLSLAACGVVAPTTQAAKPTNNPTTTQPAPTQPQPTTTAPHTHAYTQTVTEPTCTEDGFTTYTCECGDTYQADQVAATGHAEEKGMCTVCNEKVACYAELTGTDWEIIGVRSGQMERVFFNFREDGLCEYYVSIYEDAMIWEDDEFEPIVYEGVEYYFAFPGMSQCMDYTVEGNLITCISSEFYDEYEDEESGGIPTIVFERVSGTELKIVSMAGQLGFWYVEPGDNFYTMAGHSFTEPTCTEGAVCSLCGAEGAAPRHTYEEGVCKHCGEKKPFDVTDGRWHWFDENENGPQEVVIFDFGKSGTVYVEVYYNALVWELGTTMPGYEAIHYGGNAYAVKWRDFGGEECKYEVKGDQIFIYWNDTTVILEKIDDEHFKVISGEITMDGYEIFRPGSVFALDTDEDE